MIRSPHPAQALVFLTTNPFLCARLPSWYPTANQPQCPETVALTRHPSFVTALRRQQDLKMDHDGPDGAPGNYDDRRNQQVDNAIRAIQQKKPRPEIDFTIHVMEDGSEVSTLERVCKGNNHDRHIQ